MVDETGLVQINIRVRPGIKDRIAATAFRHRESMTAFMVRAALAVEQDDWEQWMRTAGIITAAATAPLLVSANRRSDGANEIEFEIPPSMPLRQIDGRLTALAAAAGFAHIHRIPSVGVLKLLCSDSDPLDVDRRFDEHTDALLRIAMPGAPDMRWALGVGADNQLVWHNYGRGRSPNPHLLIAGKSGSGKTTILCSMLHQLCHNNTLNQMQLHLIGDECAPGTWPHEATPRPAPTQGSAAAAADTLEAVVSEMKRRVEAAIAAGQQQADRTMPVLLVVVDDCHAYLADPPEKTSEDERAHLARAAAALNRLARQGHAAGVRVAASTQHAGHRFDMGSLKATSEQIGLAAGSAGASRAIIDANGLDDIRTPGRGVLATSSGFVHFKAFADPPAAAAAPVEVSPPANPGFPPETPVSRRSAAGWSRAGKPAIPDAATEAATPPPEDAAVIGTDPAGGESHLLEHDRHFGVAVHGDPGTGKTTLMLALLAGDCRRRAAGRHHPIIWLATSPDSAARAAAVMSDNNTAPVMISTHDIGGSRLDLLPHTDSPGCARRLAAAVAYAHRRKGTEPLLASVLADVLESTSKSVPAVDLIEEACRHSQHLGVVGEPTASLRRLQQAEGLWRPDSEGAPRLRFGLQDLLTYGEAAVIDASGSRQDDSVAAAVVLASACAAAIEHCEGWGPAGKALSLFVDDLGSAVPDAKTLKPDPVADILEAAARSLPGGGFLLGVKTVFGVQNSRRLPMSTAEALQRCGTRAYFRTENPSAAFAASTGLHREYDPRHIAQLPTGTCAIRMMRDGTPQRPFLLRPKQH